MAVYFTSDLHLGHENIILTCGREFSCADDMNEFLITKWNRKVTDEDEVYILGDLSFRSKRPVKDHLERLKGRKHLIMGNHDPQWLKSVPDPEKYFESVSHLEVMKIDRKLITLCHYPMLEWNGSRRSRNQETALSWLIHGHIHNAKDHVYEYIRDNLPCALNCGVDINGYEPVTFEELLANNNRWYGRAESDNIE